MKAIIATLTIILLMTACSQKVDKTKDFAMTMNGNAYKVKMGPAEGRIIEQDVGFTDSFTLKVIFPLKAMNPMKARGFQFSFDAAEISPGEIIESEAGDDKYHLAVEYFPHMGHRVNEGIMLAYTSRRKTGYLKARFDLLEPQVGGRVKGVILEAVLFAYFDDNQTAETTDPPKEKKLEIYNFPFDTTFALSPF